MGRERNREHRLATLHAMSREEVLAVAGRLCAVLLLTGEAEYAADDEAVDGQLPLTGFEEPSQKKIDAVYRTLLFDVRDGRVTPRHRHVAEFLGGRYLARVVEELPVGRVLALVTGFDGGVVSELRGLAAWFAAFSVAARAEMVERDPLGVVLYGDVKGFSPADKKAVIGGLGGIAALDPASLTLYRETDARWGDLATEDMEPVFAAALAEAGADETREAVAVVVPEALANGARIPVIEALLLDGVRDGERALGIRELALKAYLNQSDDAAQKVALANKIVAGEVSDPRDELLGKLLWDLYPGVVESETVADYFVAPKAQSSGWLAHFWLLNVPRPSSSEQLEAVMDGLLASGRFEAVRDRGEDAQYQVRMIPGRLLWELLKRGHPDVERVFDWLAVIDPRDHFDKAERIRNWFKDNSETFQAVFRMSVEREEDPDSLRRVGGRLMRMVGPPDGFSAWCLAEADTATDPRSASRFVHRAAVHWDGEPLWDEIEGRLVRRPGLVAEFMRAWEERQKRIAALQGQPEPKVSARVQRRLQAWGDAIAAEAQALKQNRVNAEFLYELARVYFGLVPDVQGAGPRECLTELLGDESLVETVLRALAMTAERDDLPTAAEVLKAASERRMFHLSLPFMAGLEERGAPSDGTEVRLAVAILVTDGAGDGDPAWYDGVVAEVLIEAAGRALRARDEVAWSLYRLTDPGHAAVAELAVPAVLRSFPSRSTSKLLAVLRSLLRVGLVCCRDAMPDLIEAKLASKRMTVGQRMYWLCAGLTTGKAAFVPWLRRWLDAGDVRRVRHVARFFVGHEWSEAIGNLGADALGMLVQAVGGSYGPVRRKSGRTYVVTTDMEVEAAVRDWIGVLAALPSRRATEILDELGADGSLSRWARELPHARTVQLEARRNATFSHASMEEVLGTLDGAMAANVGDVAALTVELLGALARQIRDGSTSDWRQYWKTGVEEPEHEDTCRDWLLSDLRHDLERYGLYGEEEGQYAEDKRSDIKVFGAGGAVPVEI